MKMKEIYDQINTEFYEDAPYIEITELLNKDFTIFDVTKFENDKGPGAAFLITVDGVERTIITHSVGLTKMADCLPFTDALKEGHHIDAQIKEGKSKKTGRFFYYFG